MMTEDKALEVYGLGEIVQYERPTEIMARSAEQAKALMDVVEKCKFYQDIEGKKYLEVEGWETILAFNNISSLTDWTRPIERDGEIVGYEARINLVNRAGNVVGSAIMPCGLDEFPCRGKEGLAKHKAAVSAAQTWAVSKAARMKFSFIAKLAGYQPTPAEEMQSDGARPKVPADTSEGACPIHGVPWKRFKKGTNSWLSHKTDDGKWCNYSNVVKSQPVVPEDEDTPEVTPIGKENATRWEAFLEQCARIGWTPEKHTKQIADWLTDGFGTLFPQLTEEAQRQATLAMQELADKS